jgi:hypothetical protein
MERERQKKAWRDIDKAKDRSTHRRDPGEAERRREDLARSNTEVREHKAALEALFAPKGEETPRPPDAPRAAPRLVLPPNPNADPRNAERRRLLAKLLSAAGPGSISKVANDFVAAGFTFPDDQEVYLQLLEHVEETRVQEAIDALSRLLAGELPKRKPVLDQRLRRIEEHAESAPTRESAAALRRLIHGRAAPAAPPGFSR